MNTELETTESLTSAAVSQEFVNTQLERTESLTSAAMSQEFENTQLESTESLTRAATSQENVSILTIFSKLNICVLFIDFIFRKRRTWASYKPFDLLENVSPPLKRKISKVLTHSQQKNIPGKIMQIICNCLTSILT